MATANYIAGRWNLSALRGRPQAVLWSDNFGQNSTYSPTSSANYLSSSAIYTVPTGTEFNNFIILSDDNRSDLKFSKQRIETQQRMVNGTLRNYFVAEKLSISWSWENLPSRAYNKDPNFSSSTGLPTAGDLDRFTSDGGAGGVEVLHWYESHPGPFWMLLAYDRYDQFENVSAPTTKYQFLSQYNQIVQVQFKNFDYDVVKRRSVPGKPASGFDFWNINLTLEEV